MQAFFAQMQAYQRVNGTQGVAMIRKYREIRKTNARVLPPVMIGIAVLTFGAITVMPLLPPFLAFLPILVVLAAVGAMLPWALRQQRETRKAHTEFVDAVLDQQEAFLRDQPSSYPHNPPAPPPAN
jgi:hypothetical protein